MKIVTGVGESAHVTSEEFRRIFEGIVGQGSYILPSGENLEPELVSNNLLKIRSGAMCHHGNISSVDVYDEIELTNGTQGVKRIDLIVNRYSKDDGTKIETSEWVYIVGMPSSSNPIAPEYTIGNMQEGDLVDDCPVFEIHLDGISVTEVKKLMKMAPSIDDLQEEIIELEYNTKLQYAEQKITTETITVPRETVIPFPSLNNVVYGDCFSIENGSFIIGKNVSVVRCHVDIDGGFDASAFVWVLKNDESVVNQYIKIDGGGYAGRSFSVIFRVSEGDIINIKCNEKMDLGTAGLKTFFTIEKLA